MGLGIHKDLAYDYTDWYPYQCWVFEEGRPNPQDYDPGYQFLAKLPKSEEGMLYIWYMTRKLNSIFYFNT